MDFAFLFPGQGSQYPGMCKNILNKFPYVKDYFLEANEILNFNILDLCMNGPEDKLNLTANAQPSILITSYCAFKILQREIGINPFLLAGHSLGEISALCCSGAIKFDDAVKIVRKRGELMQSAAGRNNGAMISISGLSINEVEKLCSENFPGNEAVVSNINSANQIVISGSRKSVEAVGSLAGELGAATIPLKVSAPFHSPLMQPAAVGFEEELNRYEFSELKIPVMSNVTCKPYKNQNEIIPLLTAQIITKVNWLRIMEYMDKTRLNITLELPPKKVLTKFFRRRKSSIVTYTFDQLDDIKKLSNSAEQ